MKLALRHAAVSMLIVLSACAGGTFHLDPSLASAPALPVIGERGFNAEACAEGDAGPAKGMAAGRAIPVSIGSFRGIASAPHREVTTTRLFRDAVLRDYEDLLRQYGDLAGSARAAAARSSDSAAADVEAAGKDAAELLGAIRFVLTMPASTTETTVFTFVGKEQDRTTLAACRTTSTARTFGAFDDPRFTLSCRLVASADGVARELRVRGHGSWANYAFAGELTGPGGERVAFSSQNVVVLGAGGIRGFDLRAPGGQLAALSFWQTRRPDARSGDADEYLPAAWIAPERTVGLRDALATTLGIAYVFPWPTGCDTARLRERGMDAGG